MFDPFPLARPLLHRMDPERAHLLTIRALELGIVPGQPRDDDPRLAVSLFGRTLKNPIGLAAGFDKNARVYARMAQHGFGFVEIGGVTPLAQVGNPRPRVFRLPADGAVINRMGFPNDGADAVEARLRRFGRGTVPLGINLAANTDSIEPADDFVGLAERFAPYAEFLTLDLSCPNTRNGHVFLDPPRLADLLARLAALAWTRGRPALVAKLGPDIDDALLERLIGVLTAARIDGIVVSNTTRVRPESLTDAGATEAGGLSGRPLRDIATAMVARVRTLTSGTVPIVGVGGIASGADAYAKIRAGATAVQLYTGLIYSGTGLVTTIKRDLAELLRRDGFRSVSEAVGVA